jgi:TadE-like protein
LSTLRSFFRDDSGGPAAEFALVLPLALIFIFGIIDVGRYMWEVNQAEKATQIGARWAVATNIIASDLIDYSFALDGDVLQGQPVPQADFPGVICDQTECRCPDDATCDFGLARDSDAFDLLVDRMAQIKPGITGDNVVVTYAYSGLGFAGDPNGPDVAPIVSVTVDDLAFTPIYGALLGATFTIPTLSYSLTMEDGSGVESN